MPQALIVPLVSAGISAGTALYSKNQQKKAEKKALTYAEQQRLNAEQEQQRLEEKYGLTQGELEREQRLFGLAEGEEPIEMTGGLEAERQKELQRRAGMSGEDLLAEAGPNTRALIDKIAKRSGMTGEELLASEGEISQTLRDQVLAEAKDPNKYFESTLAPELELVRGQINAEANKRGVFSGLPAGGVRFEQLGRAGVELAIKSARARMDYRQQALNNAAILAERAIELSKEARGESAAIGESALGEQERARTEMDSFLANLQSLDTSAKNRAANVGISASNQATEQKENASYFPQSLLEYNLGKTGQNQSNVLSLIGSLGEKVLSNTASGGLSDIFGGTGSSVSGDSSTLFDKYTAMSSPQQSIGSITGSNTVSRLKKKYPSLLADY